MTGTNVLSIRGLETEFASGSGAIRVVDGVSIDIPRGQTVALVGESGCGKSVTALSVLGLLPPAGQVAAGLLLLQESPEAAPIDLAQLPERAMRRIRGGRIAIIFQEPLTALNPVFTIGDQIGEAVELHQGLRGRAARRETIEILRRVGIADPHKRVDDYPHQLSGGMRQRAVIGMALACRPVLLIADEPTTALDVTVQAQILDLLKSIQSETGMSVLLITHDLGVVAETADYVHVMYAGRIVEHAPTDALFARPLHPYTRGLLRCTPHFGEEPDRLEVIPGAPPDAAAIPTGCAFHPRCALSAERAEAGGRASLTVGGRNVLRRCVEPFDAEPSGRPFLRELSPAHFAACWEQEG